MSAPIVRPLISQNNQLWENTESKAYLRTLAHQKSRLERQEQINERTGNVKDFQLHANRPHFSANIYTCG